MAAGAQGQVLVNYRWKLLAELINGESGDPTANLVRRDLGSTPPDVQQMEAQPDARAALSQRVADKN